LFRGFLGGEEKAINLISLCAPGPPKEVDLCKVMAFVVVTNEVHPAEAVRAFQPGLPDGTYILRPEIAIWVNFGGHCNGKGV
jgi:hypothetical protein